MDNSYFKASRHQRKHPLCAHIDCNISAITPHVPIGLGQLQILTYTRYLANAYLGNMSSRTTTLPMVVRTDDFQKSSSLEFAIPPPAAMPNSIYLTLISLSYLPTVLNLVIQTDRTPVTSRVPSYLPTLAP